jgi:hypothetical protein
MIVGAPGTLHWSPQAPTTASSSTGPERAGQRASTSWEENFFAKETERGQDRTRMAQTLKAFAERLDSLSSKLRSIRPDIADADYDLKLEGKQLVVVDDQLDERSRTWLEVSLNGDRELVRLARSFNDEAVLAFDTHNSGPKVYPDNRRSYDHLDATIDRSTRFVSLLKEISKTVTVPTQQRASHFFGSSPFERAAALVEKQIIGDTYAYQAKGGALELMRDLSDVSFFGWSEDV